MIAASDPQEFVPSGRQQALKHPGPRQSRLPPHGSHEDFLNKFEKVSLKEKVETEWWILRKLPAESLKRSWPYDKVADRLQEKGKKEFAAKNEVAFMEDELYVRGHTAIWTRGLSNCDHLNNGGKTICAYTTPFPVRHANWCTFYCEHPNYDFDLVPVYNKDEGPTGVPVPALCIIDSHNIRVFTQKGEDFVSAVPFEIEKMWNTRYGVFFEKNTNNVTTCFYECKATLYSLAFPLNEAHPVAVSTGLHVDILNNNNMKLVFTNENPSICMFYDAQTQVHSVYVIRKVTNDEKFELENKLNSTAPSVANLSNRLKSRLSMWDCLKNSNYLPVPSPIGSRPESVTSFINTHHSKSHSSMATVSRMQSPATSSIGSSFLQKSSRLNCSFPQNRHNYAHSKYSSVNSSKYISNPQGQPVICLEHIWTEPTQDGAASSAASKVFLCSDLTDQWYLCYVLSTKFQLFMIKIDFSDKHITFGTVTRVGAKDAVAIPMLQMLAILEHNGNVNLYSGLTPVGKLHLGGTLVQHTPSPYVRRNLNQFNSPFPRRSSLLPHCKQSDPKFDEHLLSPVMPETPGVSHRTSNVLQLNFQVESNLSKVILSGLRDPLENRLTLRYSDGTYYRITLPPLTAHSLIESCVTSLRCCLSRDTILVILTRWYSTRNALGAQDLNLEQEWKMFQTLLFELLGYDTQHTEAIEDCPITPSNNPKRQKHSFSGSDDDWSYMLNSNYESSVLEELTTKFKLKEAQKGPLIKQSKSLQINVKSVLFPQIKLILYCLHLLYEDLKLNTLRQDDLKVLAGFLSKLAGDLDLVDYSVHYWKDFPDLCSLKTSPSLGVNDKKHIVNYNFIDEKPANIMQFIYDLIQGKMSKPFRFINNVNVRSRDIVQMCGIVLKEIHLNLNLDDLLEGIEPNLSSSAAVIPAPLLGDVPASHQLILLLTKKKITIRDLDTLPPSIYLFVYSSLWKCRNAPPPDLPTEAYNLLWRQDLAAQAEKIGVDLSSDRSTQLQAIIPTAKQVEGNQHDGMEDIENTLTKLRFPDDVRVAEARKMLQSSKPVPIVLVQRPDVSDHDFIEEQEKHLYAICARTMSLSTGRGMFTLRISTPVVTEPLQTPQLCLTGKGSPRGTTVELNHIDTPANMNCWPLFHNGVANGLRISPDARNIDGTWIIFNKAKGSIEQQMEHAGFLMALGLNGHLKNLDVLNTYDYLMKLHEMTSIGLLLGMSAVNRGTSNMNLLKTLSIHIEALLPPTSMELDVHHNVQVAALLGLGFVYQGSSHRHIIEVLLSEIGRPPGPEMENSIDRESYSLAAGLSLGLVSLKQGSCSLGLADLNISDTLYYYMVGGHRRPLTGAQKDKYKVPSFQIREGSSVNLDVTAPGATIALGLMYLGSGNKAVADWMSPPETQYLLDFVRPDFLMFRILSRALILWDEIEPTQEWVEKQVPATILPYCMIKPPSNSDIDYEAMNQAYCNIVTGACFALGLKFAGSADEDAFETLLHFCRKFTNLTLKPISELAGKPTVETCLNLLLLSTAMVMAGTGNLEIMRFVRLLRRRVGVASSAVVTYGSHLALHMALGLLFLGGGRYTLSNSHANVAALICAFYPKFPTHSNDNRYHLQAFRHLYVLAVEPRLVIPRDVHVGKRCYAMLKVVKMNGQVMFVKGPGIIPNLDILQEVAVDDERYWPVVFKRGHNWDALVNILESNGFIEVQQKAGCLSYTVDKLGYHSQLAKTLTESGIVPWDPSSSAIISFTHDPVIKNFCDYYLGADNIQSMKNETQMCQILTKITYDAVVKDKLIVVPVIAFLLKVIYEMKAVPRALNFWQVKIVFAQILSSSLSTNLISSEVALALQQQIVEVLDEWETSLLHTLQYYIKGNDFMVDNVTSQKLATYVTYYDIPFKHDCIKEFFLQFIVESRDTFCCKTVEKIAKLCFGL